MFFSDFGTLRTQKGLILLLVVPMTLYTALLYSTTGRLLRGQK